MRTFIVALALLAVTGTALAQSGFGHLGDRFGRLGAGGKAKSGGAVGNFRITNTGATRQTDTGNLRIIAP